MWLNQTLLASALLAALMISPAWGQETQEEKTVDTSGVWELTIQTPRGAMTRTLTLEQDGTSLEGTLDTRMGSVPITEGSVEGNRISFTVAMSGRGGRTFEMSYRGSVDGDTARGTFRTPRGDEVEWTGKRIKRRS